MKELKCWFDIPQNHDFSIYNIPFGVFYTNNQKSTARAGAALGDFVIDLNSLFKLGYLSHIEDLKGEVFEKNKLNDLLSLGNKVCNNVRYAVQELFSNPNSKLKKHPEHLETILIQISLVKMLLPIQVKDYVDFYSSLDHAINLGKMFRDEKNPLLPNWKHIPIGYHGRSSSIIVGGTNFKRPKGQLCAVDSTQPTFGLTKQLDFELEMAFITCKNTALGEVISPDECSDAIFGFALFNDWSARDIQRWEYVPLGPFLGKSFASSLSPWLVSLEALTPFALPSQDKDVSELEYLKCKKNGLFDIHLEIYIQSDKMQEPFLISRSNYKYMYWNLFQQLAHMTSNGSPISVGDVYASGTISGPYPESYGSMLELAWKGNKPITLPDGSRRSFIEDGDTVIFKGFAINEHVRIGFGELSVKVLPS
ncbi:fumarylacetoacetase [Fluviispira multicolorata]|uniref:fumarylacetoacetase n=1 Tax=Fluviispira multicolorata TaxID=2654512 RepID=A0A833N0I9_9BACT|nr:fumarylacetoacetase [Fluviispira multicolorata]KAB8028592.1 fumarylacetoacetase [Fluviispira multicolorata]